MIVMGLLTNCWDLLLLGQDLILGMHCIAATTFILAPPAGIA